MNNKVFFSYSREDEPNVKGFKEAFELRNIPVWIDYEEIGVSSSLSHSINEGLKNSRDSVVFFSESYNAKEWPRAECNAITNLMIAEVDRDVVVVRLDQTPVPPLLTDRIWSGSDDRQQIADWFATKYSDSSATLTVPDSNPPSEVAEIINFPSRLDHTSIERLGRKMIEVIRSNTTPLPFKFYTKNEGNIIVEILDDQGSGLIEDLDHQLVLSGYHRRHIQEFEQELAIGGLGALTGAFKVRLEQKIEELEKAREAIRALIDALTMRAMAQRN
tara:strand:+ start:14913 stop:15734 length:822 start_codon:yes stop_codon:yes gene_type:complete